jgi:hypothetical protein
MRRLAGAVARAPILSALFALALLGTALFGLRATVSTLRWADPARQDQEIAGWMTPRYVARSWDVPPELVAAALGLQQDGTGRRATLQEIAEARGLPLAALVSALEAAIADHRGGT